MSGFYRRALSKIDKLTAEQCRQLLFSASGEIIRLEAVLDSLPQGILVCDARHSLMSANKSSLRLLPISSKSDSRLENAPLWECIHDERLAVFFQASLQATERVWEHELDVEAQGISRLLSISILPLVDQKKITGSLIHVEDITEKRGKEARLRRAENLASMTTLAAAVAHEIKNPLGAISIHLQLMQKILAGVSVPSTGSGTSSAAGDKDEKINQYFNILNEEVDRLNRIVVDFLFAVRPMSLDLREGDLNAIIGEIAEFIRAELEPSRIRLLLELDEKVPPALIDERYMKQALLNLITNARAAMPQGGLLTIATQIVDNEILVSVCDTGVGMSAQTLNKIFEPYFTTRDNGTGLGLTLVYKIIKEHQGEIAVESREGEGSNFEISLPVYQKEPRMIEYNEGQHEI